MAMKKLNFESEMKEAKKVSFFEKLNPARLKDVDWAKWKKKNLTLIGLGKFAWIILRFILIVGISFMILYPFLIKTVVAFMSPDDLLDKTVAFIARNRSTYFVERAMLNMNYWSSLLNSAILSLIVAVCQLITSSLVGYGFARFNFKGKGLLFGLVILTLIIPSQTIMLPLFVRFRYFIGDLNLLNTFWPLAILSISGLGLKNGLYIFMLRQLFRGMPKEFEMSAYIDGAGPFKTFALIMLPNALNMMLTVFLFSFTWQWTDFTYNKMLMAKMDILTNKVDDITRAVEDIMQQQALIDTASLLIIFPLLIIFLFAQRYFIQSIERSGLVE